MTNFFCPNKKYLLIFFLCSFWYFFAPVAGKAAGPTILNSSNASYYTTWKLSESPYVVTERISLNFDLVIEPGVVIKMKKGAEINFNQKVSAIGTKEKRIIFTSYQDDTFAGDTNRDGDKSIPMKGDWKMLNLHGSGLDMNFEYVGFYYGSPNGYVIGTVTVNGNNNVSIRNSEIKYSGYIGLYISSAKPTIEENIISNNNIGILVMNPYGMVARVASSSIVDNNAGAIVSDYIYDVRYMRLDARGNWWGDKSGPYYKPYTYGIANLGGLGNSIGDGVKYDPWLGQDPSIEREPVVLVPGIGAAVNLDTMVGGLMNDNWTMFDHTYDGIIEAFKSMGYEENKDLFICYYDWRQKNDESARNYLKPLIEKATNLNGTSKVNIIAHSMGGLVARSYIQGSDYQNDVDNLFMIGTPNHGSSDVYPVWEGGYVPKGWPNELIIKTYASFLTYKYPTSSKYESIHGYIPSVKELLPVYDFIHPVGELENKLDYALMHEQNNFLLNLNNGINVLNDRVNLSVFVGTGEATVNNIPVLDVAEAPLWIDGKPEPIDPIHNDFAGDGRVLLSSATIASSFFETLIGDHGDIVSQAESSIALRLNESLDIIYPSPVIDDEMIVWVASPVDIEIVAPDNKTISSSQNDIPLARFASESKPDGVKMISIPNPVEGEYKINLLGNGDGEYHLGMEYVDNSGTKTDASSVVTDVIVEGEVAEYVIRYNSQDESPVEEILPKDEIPPFIEAQIVNVVNENGWYKEDVSIHFEAYDLESGLQYVTSDIVLSNEGEGFRVVGIAADKAGNTSTAIVEGINIDKSVPLIELEYPVDGETYLRQEDLEIIMELSDNLSGVVSSSIYLDDKKLESTSTALATFSLGEYILYIEAEDLAGNTASTSLRIIITANIDTAMFDVERLYDSGDIKKEMVEKSIIKELEQIQKMGQKFEDKKHWDGFQKNILKKYPKIKYLFGEIEKKVVLKKYESLQNQLMFYLEKRWISQVAYDIISEDIDYLIKNL